MGDLVLLSEDAMPPPTRLYVYFLDLAAAIRSLVGTMNTIRHLASKILMVPSPYRHVFVAPTKTRVSKEVNDKKEE